MKLVKEFDDEFPPNTTKKELKELLRKSYNAIECVIQEKVNQKISIEEDSMKIVGKE